jgi:hypothetical protein
MRMSFICSVITIMAFATLGSSTSRAEIGSTSRYHYAACSCHYGYPGRECVPVVACESSGGRCGVRCMPGQADSGQGD